MNHPPRHIAFRSKHSWAFADVVPRQHGEQAGADRVTRIAREDWASRFCAHNDHPGQHGAFQVLSGRGWFQCRDTTWPLSNGSVVWYQPDEARAFWCDPRRPLSVMILSASGAGWNPLLSDCLGAEAGCWQLARTTHCQQLLGTIRRLAAEQQVDGGVQAAHLLKAWLYQVRADRSADSAPSEGYHTWLQARGLIHRQTVASVPEMAEALAVSPSYLARVFRRFDDDTPHTALLRRRLLHAQHLLTETDQPLSTIALDSGFADQSSFGKTFRRLVGSSPGQFRKRFAR